MASLLLKGKVYHCQFLYEKKRYTFWIGPVKKAEAESTKAQAEHLLMRIRQGFKSIPEGVNVSDFIRDKGEVARDVAEELQKPEAYTLAVLRDEYLKAVGGGALELNTLSTTRIHFKHLLATFGEDFDLASAKAADLQKHIAKRQPIVAPVTIRKELATLKTAWTWAKTMGRIEQSFPVGKLIFNKDSEKLPFMTLGEIQKRLGKGGSKELLNESLYLNTTEIEELLAYLKEAKGPKWLYVLCCLAAHTGMRRSELIRAQAVDVDFSSGIITVREKKRVKGQLTTRRVPLTKFIEALLREWIASRPRATFLFGKGTEMITGQAAQELFRAAVVESKWELLSGFHTLRHSFVSACAGKEIDQRLVQEWCGHMDEKTSRRYRHLWPSTQRDAIGKVFG